MATKKLKHIGPVDQAQIAGEFDRLTDTYEDKINTSIAFAGREHGFYIDVKRNILLEQARDHFGDISRLSVLDLGCGIGAYHAGLKGEFGALHGIDVSARSVELARQRHDFVEYATFDGGQLPYVDRQFDLAFAVCVMHHVPPPDWPGFVQEMSRVLRPGGLALVFEHNPYNPATQYIVRSCEIDKDAVLLRPVVLRRLFNAEGFSRVRTRTLLTILPTNGLTTRLDRSLGALPFGAQYYLSATKPLR